MKTSIKLAVLAFGAASLAAVMTAPASAGDCKDVVGITNFLQCFTRPPDQLQDKEGDLKRDSGGGVHSIAGTGIHVTPGARVDYKGIGTISGVPMPSPHVDYMDIVNKKAGVVAGPGGSGGKHSAN